MLCQSQLTPVRSGVFVYAILNGLIGLVVFLSRGYIEPREYDLKEYWTWKGSGQPPWFVRAIRRRRGGHGEDDADEPASDSPGMISSSSKDDQLATNSAPMARSDNNGASRHWEP